MESKQKYLIIGGGAVVREYYIPALSYLKILDAVTVIEPDSKSAALLRQAKINVIEEKFEKYFYQNDINYDFAIITLPNHLHELAIKICLKNNITVLCEKPLSLSMESCNRIIDYQNHSDKKVYTGMVRRFMPSFMAMYNNLHLVGNVKEVIVEDGNPFAWVADSYAFFDPRNGGVLADMGVHYLDLLYKLFGSIEAFTYEDDAEGGVEANCTYQLKTQNDIPIVLKLSRTTKLKNKFEIIGSRGKLWIEKDKFDTCYFSSVKESIHEIRIKNAFNDPKLNYTFEACFVQQLTSFFNQDKSLVNLEDATAVVKLIEDAYQKKSSKSSVINKDQPSYFITGGTGFIGTALIERLWNNGIRNIKAPVRSYKNCAPIARLKIELPRLDLLDYDAVKQSIKGWQYVIHLAYAADGANAYEMNVTATQNVIKAACEQGAEAVVVLSTMNVYGLPNGEVTENTSQKPAGGAYGKTKKIMQEWVLNFAKSQSKTRIVVLNPTCVYGPNGKTYTTLPITLAKHNRFCWVDEGKGLANIVYIENLLDAIMQALLVKNAHAQNFIITDGTLTWKEFLSPFLGKKKEQIISLKKEDLLNGSFNEKSNLKQIKNYLLSNFEFVSLINAHPYLGSFKKVLFSRLPQFRNKLANQRQVVWDVASADNLSSAQEEKFNPPIWLNELFGFNSSQFSAAKAKEILRWTPAIDIATGIKQTKKWLESNHE
ncbi:NAD-dependent epimerase/dehydratase family protein [Pedobacter chinensis]|uniref:NAD-dependent epimerase/dehydratase family protein n=1 Tax=Pedobacter chinensis TaxID=2282421 RepID=A0A369Q1K6_9SPHI|nr:NAD-dependent epimerase/dehydratase family protein [Pedobacter chinensis]RDC56218.1 NAD-dependent epimerase/dehydratase family protein [Pedobacter chinensis]